MVRRSSRADTEVRPYGVERKFTRFSLHIPVIQAPGVVPGLPAPLARDNVCTSVVPLIRHVLGPCHLPPCVGKANIDSNLYF